MSRLRTNAPRGSIFSQVKNIRTPQTRFNLSYINKLSCNMGELIPFYVEDVVPGDKFDIRAGIFGRLQPMVAPVMQDIDIEVRYFYCPYRILWKNFEDYMTAKGDHVFPYFSTALGGLSRIPRLFDFFGVHIDNETQTGETNKYAFAINQMPFRAYALIYKEFFADENLDSYSVLESAWDTLFERDGQAPISTWGDVFKVAWKKDYFTSALPFTQRGDMAQFVGDVFLKGQSPQILRYMNGDAVTNTAVPNVNQLNKFVRPGENGNLEERYAGIVADHGQVTGYAVTADGGDVRVDPNGSFGVAFTINELRQANAVQRFLERSAISGNRFSEYILGMFGVKCADSRLQRPEYLGGGRMPFTITPVLQQEQAQLDYDGDPYDNSTPQGNLAGIGSLSAIFGINKPMFFPEYGVVLGLLYIRPKANYMGGVRRYMNVGVVDVTDATAPVPYINDRLQQFYNPFFANLGEDGVISTELKADGTSLHRYGDMVTARDNANTAIFGYQSRYAFMKFRANEIHGDFLKTLKYWHLGREFLNVPELNQNFIQCEPSTRIWAVEDESDKILLDISNVVDAVRPLPKYGTPTL